MGAMGVGKVVVAAVGSVDSMGLCGGGGLGGKVCLGKNGYL